MARGEHTFGRRGLAPGWRSLGTQSPEWILCDHSEYFRLNAGVSTMHQKNERRENIPFSGNQRQSRTHSSNMQKWPGMKMVITRVKHSSTMREQL